MGQGRHTLRSISSIVLLRKYAKISSDQQMKVCIFFLNRQDHRMSMRTTVW